MVAAVQDARKRRGLPAIPCDSLMTLCKKGIDHSALDKLLRQMPPEEQNRKKYIFKVMKEEKKSEEDDGGCARTDGLFSAGRERYRNGPYH